MFPAILFAAGIFFVILGATKTTAFKQYPELHEVISVGFFVYGFLNITVAVFLFTAVAPYGSILNVTVSNDYLEANQTIHAYDNVGTYLGYENQSIRYIDNQTTSYAYSTTQGGSSIATLFFYINLLLFMFYVILWGIMVIRDVLVKRKVRKIE